MQPAPSHTRRDWIDRLILIILALSLVAGFLLRTYRMDWDRGHQYLFHPDERAVVYSAIANISLPFPLDTQRLLRPDSPLNPHFFNYGNLPMYLVRAGAHVLSFVVKNAWTNEKLWMTGRGLSALFDIATILIAFLLGRKLYGRRVGLLAAVFGSFTVLHIQLSHFLTVDTYLTTFIALGMYVAIDIVRKGSLRASLLMGIALGMAMATKVSVAPLLASVVVAWGLWALRGSSDAAAKVRQRLTLGDRTAKAILGLLIAVLASGVIFVVTSPYAIIDWTSFMRSVDEQSRMVRGIADYPYTRQYLYTPVFLYQIWHSAIWGMGVPLGVAAYSGLIFITARVLVRRSSEEIVLMSWVLVYFFINGIFQVKFMRYMLPLYPFLAIMAAELLWQAWDWAGKRHNLSLRGFFSVPVAYAAEREASDDALQDAEEEAWEREKAQQAGVPQRPARRASATTRRRGRQISTGPANATPAEPPAPTDQTPMELPTPQATVSAAPMPVAAPEPLPAVDVPLPVAPAAVPELEPEGAPVASPEVLPAGPLAAVEEQSALVPAQPLSTAGVAQALRSWTRGQLVVGALMAFVIAGTVFYALAFMNIYRQVHPWISISEWIYRNVPVGKTISNEHWDDALPLGRNVDGVQRTFEQYKHVEATNYEDDNQAKLDMLVNVVTKADYIVLATNRLYGTIARLPERYPITSRYYELLFAEQLGFKLVAFSAVYPSLAGVTFMNDTLVDPPLATPALLAGNKPAGLTINLGKADESFTVYDHPMPLVFQKVQALPEQDVRALFAGTVEKAQQYQMKRQQARSGAAARAGSGKTFLLSDAERTAQEAGGTYVELFDPNSLANRLPVLVWWLAIQIITLVTLPIGYVVFGNLRDRGYAVTKTLGLLLVAYLPWLLGSFKLLAFGRISIMLSLLIVALLSFAIWRQRGGEIVAWLREHRWLVLANEIVFGVAFLAFVGIRVLNPDLWQPWTGGEKPMEFAFLSAIARSTYFPPYDPFFAGGYINYYYYGMYICAMVIRLTGIMPSVAFNLIIPMLFALTCANAFSIVYNLVAALTKRAVPADASLPAYLRAHGSLLAWALAGALFVTVIGNLATMGEVFKGPYNKGQTAVKSSIPGVSTVLRVVDGLRKGLQPGQRVFETFNYWNPSRVIPETINEFPFWSYLFADLHPHTIGIPFTLLVLTLALNLIKERRQRPAPPPAEAELEDDAPAEDETGSGGVLAWIQERLSGIRPDDVLGTLVLGLAVGSLGAINTWDLPTYLGALLCATVLRAWVETGRINFAEIVIRFGVIAGLSLLLYMPFYQKYAALASGIGLVRSRTPVGYYVAIYGFFLFVIISFMVVDVTHNRRGVMARLARLFTRYFDDAPLVLGRIRRTTQASDSVKVGLYVVLALVLVCVALLLLKQAIIALLLPLLLIALARGLAARGEPERVFTWVLVFTGFLVSLGIEIVFLRDWLQGGSSYRMNTLFKFGIQIWVFLALASAVGLAVVADRLKRSARRAVSGASLWYVVLVGLLFVVFLFPVLGIPARANDRFPGARPPTGTLDGTAFMSVGTYNFDWERKNYTVDLSYDYQAIQWLLRHVEGSPVIAEAVLPYYRELGARVSAYTGMPTLVGNQHEQEQRPGDTQVGPRENDARAIYNETSFDKVLPLLSKHRVRYIYVGQLEQAIYAPAGLAKFDQAVGTYLDLVYENPKVTIYYVRPQ